MTIRSVEPPWEFLLSASKNSLQNFELSRLSNAANLRKEIVALVDQWLADQASATVARLLLEERERAAQLRAAPFGGAKPDLEAPRVSDNFFADRSVSQHCNGGKT